jgi:hypothetical protein
MLRRKGKTRQGKDKYKTPSRKVDIAALTAFTIKEKDKTGYRQDKD